MITLFENYSKYNIGDYILLKMYKKNTWQVDRECKIISFSANMIEVEGYHHYLYKNINFFVFPYEIQRKLKPDEIEKLKINLKSKKYNI